jgi:predicted nucleic acid-binding protein
LRVEATVARRKVELLAEFDIAAVGFADIVAAIDLQRMHGFAFWDALVLRGAKEASWSIVFSQDLLRAQELNGCAS